jgi:hypothetical protein
MASVEQNASSSGEVPVGDSKPSVVSQAQEKLSDLAEPLKDKAMEAAQVQKDVGADQLGVVARAVHGAAEKLEPDMPGFASYIHDTGKWLEETASDMRTANLEQLAEKVGRFAKRQPSLVFGGAILTGLALSRFLKSSAPGVKSNANTSGASGSSFQV